MATKSSSIAQLPPEVLRKRRAAFRLGEHQYDMFVAHEHDSEAKFCIYPKGRRLGATNGAAIMLPLWAQKGLKCLWVDVINGNIDRYVERYVKPFLQIFSIPYKWNVQKREMQVGRLGGYIDFRSADKPESLEGFGYHKIFLNEAGIILHDEYLYYNAILPMMLDFPESQLIAAGTPKLLGGRGRLFYELYQKAMAGEFGYHAQTFNTYDNCFLTRASIDALKMQIPAIERDQEIYGKFILEGGSIMELGWFNRYRVTPASFSKIILSLDTAQKDKEVNDPTACTVWGVNNSNYYLLDVIVERWKYPDLKRNTKNLAHKWKPNQVMIEDKSSGSSLIQDLQVDPEFTFNIKAIEPDGNKVTRFSTASLTVEAGRVFIPETAAWLPAFEKEITEFPNVEHDDQCDSVSQFLNEVGKSVELFIG